MYNQVLDPVSHSLGLSSMFAVLPLLSLFALLGGVRMKAQWASLIALGVAVCGLLTVAALGVAPRRALAIFTSTVTQLRWAILTVCSVLALAYVMNLSGQTITLGMWVAGAGAAFAFLSPTVGWFGTAVTGSDTSANSLFGALQVAAAHQSHLSPTLLASTNSSGGVMGQDGLAPESGHRGGGGRPDRRGRRHLPQGDRLEPAVRPDHGRVRVPAIHQRAVLDGALVRHKCNGSL
jgi:L-lactate permease